MSVGWYSEIRASVRKAWCRIIPRAAALNRRVLHPPRCCWDTLTPTHSVWPSNTHKHHKHASNRRMFDEEEWKYADVHLLLIHMWDKVRVWPDDDFFWMKYSFRRWKKATLVLGLLTMDSKRQSILYLPQSSTSDPASVSVFTCTV